MKIDVLEATLHATPFVPFTLVLPNGERLLVPHPDFAWVHPSKRCVSVALASGGVRMVNWQMVTAIETGEVGSMSS